MIILFDLDGTLIDSTEAILESFHNSFDIYSYPHPQDKEIAKLIGHPLDVMYERLGVDRSRVWDFVATYKEHYRKISKEKTFLLPNAFKSVVEASKVARLGIVTTKTARYSKDLMEHFKLIGYFEVLIGRENVENPKPHPEPILKALEAMNYKSERCIMIGDTVLDIEAAHNANIDIFAVESGYDTKETLLSCKVPVFKDALEAVESLSIDK